MDLKEISSLSVEQLQYFLENHDNMRSIFDSKKSRLDELNKRLNDLNEVLNIKTSECDDIKNNIKNIKLEIDTINGINQYKRVRNTKKLYEYIIDILKNNNNGLTISAIAKKALNLGYNTNSKVFGNTVYQCLHSYDHIFTHDKNTRLYKINKNYKLKD